MTEPSLKTPLYDTHVALGGRMVSFAGYDMPVQYASVIAESKAVREKAGMFDVSHMARLRLNGTRTQEYLEWVTTNDISKLAINGGQYSLLPNFQGGAVDDIIVYKVGNDAFRMVVNASNHAKDVAWLHDQNNFSVEILDDTDGTAMIAVQGPGAVEILAEMSNKPDELRVPGMFGVVECEIAGVQCFAPRSGYTGEDGYELICPAQDATRLWNALLAGGVAACGLGARDVLRVEAGLPLYGHELDDDMSPLDAGLGWVISKSKEFIGSDKYNIVRTNGVSKKLQGIRLNSKRLLSPGMKVFADGEEIGEVSSGVYSPMLECGIAFAFLDPKIELGTVCGVDVRGKLEPATVVNKRFFKRSK